MQPVKNKGLTYLLICVVCLVWGIIIYRLFFIEAGDDGQTVFLKTKSVHEPYDKYTVKNDTFKLALNYRDPFAGKVNAVADLPKTDVVTHTDIKPFKPVPPPLNWSGIKYSGYITNPKTKKMVAILIVNGKERMTAEGESLEGVKLLKNKKDSILVSWMGKQKYIRQ
jgi:type II secretory pathway component PulC